MKALVFAFVMFMDGAAGAFALSQGHALIAAFILLVALTSAGIVARTRSLA